MNKQSNNIQDIFLNNARKTKTTVSIYLVNGFQLRGIVKGFDSFTVILDSEGKQIQKIYKSYIFLALFQYFQNINFKTIILISSLIKVLFLRVMNLCSYSIKL